MSSDVETVKVPVLADFEYVALYASVLMTMATHERDCASHNDDCAVVRTVYEGLEAKLRQSLDAKMPGLSITMRKDLGL